MTQPQPFRYVATFRDHQEAGEEFAAADALHRAGLLGTFGAALITRDPSGEVGLSTHERPAERGAVRGALAGVLLGHLRAGWPRRALQRLAATLAPGEAAVVVVGESRRREALADTNGQWREAAQHTGS